MSCLYPKRIYVSGLDKPLDVRCGHCKDCQVYYSFVWSVRCRMEMSLHSDNCVVTLTYRDVPSDGVSKRDFQLFMKRLRKRFSGKDIRYFGCGEYGSKNGRPHYHIILFGIDFPDKVLFKSSKKGNHVFVSSVLSSLWPAGFATIGSLSEQAIPYCVKYLSKYRTYSGLNKPFVLMSRRPAIGFRALTDSSVNTGFIYLDGKRYSLCSSFLHMLDARGYDVSDILTSRSVYLSSQEYNHSDADYYSDALLFRNLML